MISAYEIDNKGYKNIGIAITDDKRLIATPYKTIKNNTLDSFLNEINKK